MKGKIVVLVLVVLLLSVAGGYVYVMKKKQAVSGLKVVSTPGASVFLNDTLLGKTPYEAKQTAGQYTLKVIPDESGSGLVSWQGTIKLEPSFLTFVSRDLGTSESLSGGEVVTLEKIQEKESQIAVFSTPDGATITLDGQDKGVSPIVLRDVLPGEHDVAVSSVGYIGRTARIQALEGYKLIVNFQMALTSQPEASPSARIDETATTTPGAGKPTPATSSGSSTAKIKDTPTGFLRVRGEPSTGGSEVGQVKPGETYPIIAEQDGWYRITYEPGKDGWVSGRYVEKLSL